MNQRERHAVNGVATIPRPADQAAIGTRALTAPSIPTSIRAIFPFIATGDLSQSESPLPVSNPLPIEQEGVETLQNGSFRQWTERILAGDPAEIKPLPFLEPIDLFDRQLDDNQADAIARAILGGGLLLVAGRSGTGKTQTIVELIRQAAARGWRVMLVAPTGAAVDSILSRLEGVAEIEAIRGLGKNEAVLGLSPTSQQLVAATREQKVLKSILERACEHEHELERQLQCFRELAPVWAELKRLIQKRESLHRLRSEMVGLRETIENDVLMESEAAYKSDNVDPAVLEIQRAHRSHAEWIAAWESQIVQLQKDHVCLIEELDRAIAKQTAIRSLNDMALSKRFWSLSYWKARFDKSLQSREKAAELEVASFEKAVQDIREREAFHRQARLKADMAHNTVLHQKLGTAVEAKRKNIDARIGSIDCELVKCEDDYARQIALVPSEVKYIPNWQLESVELAETKTREHIQVLEESLCLAKTWRTYAEIEGDLIVRQWSESVRLFAAPINALGHDRWLMRNTAPFDLTIVADAHLLSENDLLQAGRRAQRWTLFGELPVPTSSPTQPSRRNAQSLPLRRMKPLCDFFARLWSRLHWETWLHDNDRLCLRLQRVPDGDRGRIERENVADRPDIELRIWNRRDSQPLLAEVLFPDSMGVEEATEYLFRELGEIHSHSLFKTGHWESDTESLIFRLGPRRDSTLRALTTVLADGVSLQWGAGSEIGFVFGTTMGWNHAKAKDWIERNVRHRDSGRACRLERNYRNVPALAEWLNVAVFAEVNKAAGPDPKCAIEFISVPHHVPNRGRNRGGSGIEIDLGDSAHRAQLPPELAVALPSDGYVNLPEARAVADLLQRLPTNRRIAVISPYFSQTELLRRFCPESVITSAELLNQTECDVLVISLTRSHVARAVTYGNDPQILLRSFLRARCRIVFVGDPGTLARRSRWEGAIDHLDEADGESERRWVSALLPYIPQQTYHSPVRMTQGAPA